jgi:hypothetical protein
MTNKKSPDHKLFFECIYCIYKTSNKKDFNKHLLTIKHFKGINANKNPLTINCECGKHYKHLSSLIKHKKQCFGIKKNPQSINSNNNLINLTNMVVDVVKQNQEFKELIIEQNNKMLDLIIVKQSNIINNNCKTNNNHFNLNFFLNEQCKDALNITDFVRSIQLQLSDLENTGKFGYVNGISKIFINGLKELDVYKRPVHCSDLKRETLYIKDKNQWSKESNELKTAINEISHKNIKQIPIWIENNPACKDISNKLNDEYLHLINNCMVGSDEKEINENYKKIIQNISKEVFIQKE